MTPPVSNCVRVQAIFQGVSGLSEDRYVNVFHFLTAASPVTTAHMDAAMDVVEDFYQLDHSAALGLPLLGYMPAHLIDENASELRAYNMELAEPREPRSRVGWITAGLGTELGLPTEVAVCLSYYSVRNTPGRRGRIFVGPLTQVTIQNAAGETRPHAEFHAALVEAGDFLMGAGTTVSWAVLAKGDAATPQLSPLEIDHVWVDDAFDTQRRRGAKPTMRLTRP